MSKNQEAETGLIPLLLAPVIYTILLPLALTLGILNEFGRLVVKVLLRYKYGSTVTLVEDGNDSMFDYKAPGNTRNVLVVGITAKETRDPEEYAKTFEKQVLLHVAESRNSWFGSSSGSYRRYEKMEKIFTTRFGYTCWKLDQQFDIRRHFRLIENPERIYMEKDVQDLLSPLALDMDESKPQWENILIPRFQDEKGEEKSAQILRFHHGYMDGMSLMLMFKNHITSREHELPLNPLTFKLALWQKIVWYVNALLYGPYMLLTLTWNKYYKNYWVLNGQYPGEKKVFAWTSEMNMNTFKQIRLKTNATIPNVIALAFSKAVQNVLPSSRTLDNIRFAEIMAILPYSSPDPVNRFAAFSYNVSLSPTPESPEEFRNEITALKRSRLASMIGPQSLLFYYTFKFFGRFPVFTLRSILDGANDSCFLSNIPAFSDQIDFFGTDLHLLCPFPPQPNNTGITMASMSYNGKIKLTGVADSSWLSEDEIQRVFIEIPKVVQSIAELGYIPNVLPALKPIQRSDVENEDIVLDEEEEEEDEDLKQEENEGKLTPLDGSSEDEEENENGNSTLEPKSQVSINGHYSNEEENDNNNNDSNNIDTSTAKHAKGKLTNGHAKFNDNSDLTLGNESEA